MATEEEANDGVPRPAGEGARGRRPILIVEDDEDTRTALRAVLEDEGYLVAEASHGEEALAWLAGGERPCLILLDLMMPVMAGREFLEVLRRDPDHAATPVVLISAWPEKAAQTQGIRGVVKKPFGLAEIFHFVERCCPAGE